MKMKKVAAAFVVSAALFMLVSCDAVSKELGDIEPTDITTIDIDMSSVVTTEAEEPEETTTTEETETTVEVVIEETEESEEVDETNAPSEKESVKETAVIVDGDYPDLDFEDIEFVDGVAAKTKYAFNLAYVYLAVKEKLNGFFYVDEQFSYINNDIEKAFISLLSAMVEEDDQIIFTTHNTDILDLNLPNHAYGFLKKVDLKISYQNAAEVEKKNNVSIKNDYDNDRFNAAPDLTLLYELGD